MEQSHQPVEQQPPLPPQQTSMGLEPNLAAALSYLVCLVTGIVFFLMEKENKFVRFHAMQSILFYAALIVLYVAVFVLSNIPFIGLIFWFLFIPIGIGGFVLWIVLMIKAYQGERFKLPLIGDLAEKHAS